MFIEDIFAKVIQANGIDNPSYLGLSRFEQEFLGSMSIILLNGVPFSEKQANYLAKILRKKMKKIEQVCNTGPLDTSFENPTFKFPFKSALPQIKTVTIETGEDGNQVIRIVFPFNHDTVVALRARKLKYNRCGINFIKSPYNIDGVHWNSKAKSWDLNLEEDNILWVYDNFKDFVWDDNFKHFANQIPAIIENMHEHIPMMIYQDGAFKFINTHSTVEQPNTSELVKALFHAKKNGISTWDETVEEMINSQRISKTTITFIKQTIPDPSEISLPLERISEFSSIIQNSEFIFGIVRSGSELSHLTELHKILKLENISNSEISVLFRLNNSTNSEFNEYVRTHGLNNPLSSNTRVVIIKNEKIPKPLVAFDKQCDLAIFIDYSKFHNSYFNDYISQDYALNLINIEIGKK